MSRIEIENKINRFLLEDIELEEELLKPEAALKDDLKIDSLDYVDIAVMIEDTFGFKIKPEDMKGVITLDDFYKFIENKLG